MAKNPRVDVINGPICKNILLFTLPLMLTSVLQLFYNAADIVVVGRFAGDESLAAVGSTSSLTNLIVNFFIGLSIGVNVLVARHIGARDMHRAQRTVHTAATVALTVGIFAGLLGFFISRPALVLMKSPADVIDKATLYLKIYFLGTPANIIYNFGSAILRASGDTTRPLYFGTVSGILNVVLNLIFVLVFKMDVAGVALATIISQYLSALLVIMSLKNNTGFCNLRISSMCLDRRELSEIIRLGIPASIQSSMFSVSNITIQSAVNSFDSAVILAGNSAASNIEGFVYIMANSFYHAVMTFISQNVGAKKHERIVPILLKGTTLAVIASISLGAVVLLNADTLTRIYTDAPEAIESSVLKMNIIVSTYFLCGIMEILAGALRGLGYSLVPMLNTIVGVCVFRIVWIYTIFEKHHTLFSLFMCYPFSWVLTLVANLIYFVFAYKKVKRRLLQ